MRYLFALSVVLMFAGCGTSGYWTGSWCPDCLKPVGATAGACPNCGSRGTYGRFGYVWDKSRGESKRRKKEEQAEVERWEEGGDYLPSNSTLP